MGKIRQGILGGFRDKVGTVVGSYWNGIFYIKALPVSTRKGGRSGRKMQNTYFKELIDLSMQLSKEDLETIYPKKPKGMSRRNLFVKQLAEYAVVLDKSKTVDLDSLCTLGNVSTTDLPAVSVEFGRNGLQISWEAVTYYRDQHPEEYPVIFLANVTQRRLFIVGSTVALGASGKQSFEIEGKPYGKPSDDFSGFMFATGGGWTHTGHGTLSVTKRPERPTKK